MKVNGITDYGDVMSKGIARKTAIIRELVLYKMSQKEIAKKYDVSESYISQIMKKIKSLIYSPKIINGKLVCYKCEKKGNTLDFHHTIETPGNYIAIVCHSCNVRLGQNYLTFKDENGEGNKFITARVTDEFYKELSRTASEYKTTLPDMIRTALEIFMEWRKKNGS